MAWFSECILESVLNCIVNLKLEVKYKIDLLEYSQFLVSAFFPSFDDKELLLIDEFEILKWSEFIILFLK